MANYLDNDIKFVAGVGEARARLLEKELGIRTLGDMLCHYPFRYIDRTRIYRIDQIAEGDSALIQFRGRITGVSYAGAGRKRRFTAVVNDGSGVAELVWFQGIKWIEKRIEVGREYLIFGRPSFFKGELSVVHPEIETIEKAFSRKAESGLQGIYSSTERLSSVLGTKGIYTIVCNLWPMVRDHIRETLPDRMRTRYGLLSLLVNVLRSVPFVILLILMIPLTVLITGTSLGVAGAIPPLVVGATPFFARLVETALREVDRGIIEATQAMGASTLQIIFRALLPEALPGLIAAATVTAITLVSYTAMSGLIGGGGLGDLAVRYGYQRYQPDVMAVTVILLLILVQILQSTGDKLVVHFSRK